MSKQSNEELIKLIKAGIDTQDNYEKLYNQNHGFIYQVIRKRVFGIYECDDLMQSAFLALVKAVELYDTTRPLEESNFLQILKYCIWNELRDLTYDMSAHMVDRIVKYNKVKDQLYSDLGRKPTDYEIALEMKIDLNKLDKIKAARRLRYKLSLDEPIGEDGEKTRLDLIANEREYEDTDFDSNIEKQNLRRLLKEALSRLPEASSNLIEKRYFKNFTLEKCGQELNVSRERVRQLEVKAFRKLRKDHELRKQVEGYISEYKQVGVNQFNNTWTSSTEWVALERERRLEWEKERIEFENRLEEWKRQYGIKSSFRE